MQILCDIYIQYHIGLPKALSDVKCMGGASSNEKHLAYIEPNYKAVYIPLCVPAVYTRHIYSRTNVQ